MSAVVLPFDPKKRRPHTTRGITPAYRQRLAYQARLAELELKRSEIRERLRHMVEGPIKTQVLVELACVQGDLELLHDLLDDGNVVSIGRRR